MNSKNKTSNYSKIKTKFVTYTTKVTENYKKEYSNDNIKLWLTNLIAPFRNHILYGIIKTHTINIIVTCLIIDIIFISFGLYTWLFKGIGIAVTLALWQYYTKWYFRTREKPWR